MAVGCAHSSRPNIVLIVTDDQGYGDLGVQGNDKIRTPHLDAFARQGVQLTRFYVSPVCSPTRASLMTGRYNYRTGVVDTFLGRSLMHSDEVTVAEMLRPAGYRTAIFGKWHLGDNYPLRAMDQGFEESLVIKGGGIGQPSDPPGGDSYFEPTLLDKGRAVKMKRYCTDVFTDAAIEFIRKHRDEPFFVYLPFNAPHSPLQVPDQYRKPYADQGLPDNVARVYGMITNIDDNVGRLLRTLDEVGRQRNTLVMFMSDNGAQGPRWTAGLRGHKGTVFEGGIRSPGFIRWPAGFSGGRRLDKVAAHIDVTPTLLEAAGVPPPPGVKIDGRSLLPALAGAAVPDRMLFVQWLRGEEPKRGQNYAVVTQRWKLVMPQGEDRPMLFDLQEDPVEKHDRAAAQPEVTARMERAYERWFADVSATRGWAPARMHLGAAQEERVMLTRQDWRGPRAGWQPGSLGHWEVEVARSGSYEVTLRFQAPPSGTVAQLKVGAFASSTLVPTGAQTVVFSPVPMVAGSARVEPSVLIEGQSRGVDYVEVRFVAP